MNQLSDWIRQLKEENSFHSSIEFFVKKANFPVLYLEYQEDKACLHLKYENCLQSQNFQSAPIYMSDPLFYSAKLYKSKALPVFHNRIQEWLGQKDYEIHIIAFNHQVISLFVYLPKSPFIKEQFFILNNHVKNFLWRKKWKDENQLDELTSYLNQKSFLKQLFIELSRARRLSLPVSLLLMEIDQFKTLQSIYGAHQTDLLMKALSKNLRMDTRTYDIMGAWPEGQLAMILPHTSERSAGTKAEKIRWMVRSSDFSEIFPSQHRLTISLGLAEYPKVSRSAESLFQSARKALLFAKETNEGNMTAVATSPKKFKPDFSVLNDPLNQLRDLT